jgi:hypothetical protein
MQQWVSRWIYVKSESHYYSWSLLGIVCVNVLLRATCMCTAYVSSIDKLNFSVLVHTLFRSCTYTYQWRQHSLIQQRMYFTSLSYHHAWLVVDSYIPRDKICRSFNKHRRWPQHETSVRGVIFDDANGLLVRTSWRQHSSIQQKCILQAYPPTTPWLLVFDSSPGVFVVFPLPLLVCQLELFLSDGAPLYFPLGSCSLELSLKFSGPLTIFHNSFSLGQ